MNKTVTASHDFSGRVAVVTGGTSGIGAATALHLASLGAQVHAVGLNADQFDVPAGAAIVKHDLDVTDESAVDALFDGLDRLDILVPAAGVTRGSAELTSAGFRQVIDINLLAAQDFCFRARPLLACSDSGAIVAIASMMSYFGSKDTPAYAASKGGIVQLVRSIAQNVADDGTRVNAVAPGFIDTPLLASVPEAAPDVYAGILTRTPMGRFGRPIEVAKTIAFLCSDDASFINGVTVPVDGGYLTV